MCAAHSITDPHARPPTRGPPATMGVGKGRWQGVSLPPRAPPPPKPRRGKRWTIPAKDEKPSLLCAAVLALLGTINAASALALAVHGTSSLPTPTPVALSDPAHHVIAPPHVTLLHAASMMAAVAVLFALDAAMDWLAEVLGVSEEVGWMGAGARWVVPAAPGVREWARRKMGCRARKNGEFPVARTVTRTLAASAAIIAILAAMRRGLGGSVTWSNLTDAAMLLPIGFFTVTMLQWIQADLAPRKSKQLRLLRRCRTAKILKPSAASPGYVNVATATGVVFVTALAYILSSPWLHSFPFDAGVSILVAAVFAFADSQRWHKSDTTGRWISDVRITVGDWVNVLSDPCLVTFRSVRAHVSEALERERKLRGLSLAAPNRHARRRTTRTARGLSRPRLLPRAPRCRLLLAVALGVVRVLLGARSLVGSIPVLAKHLLEPILNWASEEGQKVGPPTVPGAWMDMDEAARPRLATLLTGRHMHLGRWQDGLIDAVVEAKEINWFVQSAEEQGSDHDRLARAFTSPAFAAHDRRLEHWLTEDEILAAKLCRAWFRAPWDPDAQAWMSVPAAAQSRSTRRRRRRRFRLLLGPVLALATKTAWLANEALLSIGAQAAELNGGEPALGADDLPPVRRKTRQVIEAEIAFLSAPR
ncbi:hypothetical protein DFJ74DRAFT_665879 [Hyaloraphidium curvatum]|nr:hypothetical protein DFJ74DRAFT_665879 [Hyaloraphidium curvatum]